MKSRGILLSLSIALVLVFAFALPASAASQFSDIASSPYSAAIDNLASMKIVGGYADGTFRPDNELARAQFAKMSVLAMGYDVTVTDVSSFTDTPESSLDNPLYPGSYVAVAAEENVITGYPDNTFRFYNDVTRAQAITIIVRAAGTALADPPEGYEGVLDYSDPTHGSNIKKAEYNGLLEGIANLASWDTAANATRGETAQLVSQLLGKAFALRVSGPTGTELYTMTELKALTSVQGYGGYKNKAGVISGPNQYQGVSLSTLLDAVGGLPAGKGVSVIASDGYASSFTNEQLTTLPFPMYNPATGDTITSITGSLQLILAYSQDGASMPLDVGPLRVAIVSPANEQVTDSKYWAKMVARIEIEK